MSAFFAIVHQTIILSFRVGGGALTGLIFFLSVLVVVPFGVGPDLNLLARIGPAILWVGALLATLLGLDRLFQDDRDDGTLDQLILTDIPLPALVLAKALGHWVATGLPLVIAAPVLGLFLNLEPMAIGAITLTLLVGTPAITLNGTVGAAVMVALRKGGILVAVLVIPVTIPVLIFGVGASMSAITGPTPFLPPFLLMAALSLLSLVIGPVAGALAIRAAQD